MFQTIVKRDGREVPYDISKIDAAIAKAMEASGRSAKAAPELSLKVEERLRENFPDRHGHHAQVRQRGRQGV